MLVKWLAKKRIKVLKKSIDVLNKELEAVAGVEKYYLDLADRELELASQYEGGMFQSKRKTIAQGMAKTFVDMRPPAVKELAIGKT